MRIPGLDGRTIWIFTLLLYAISLTSLHFAMTAPWHLASLDKLANFEAAEPFQHRLLVPTIVAALHTFLPIGERLLFALLEILGWIALVLVAQRALACFGVGGSQPLRRLLAFTIVVPVALHLIVPDLIPYPLFSLDGGLLELGNWRAQRLFYYAYDLPAAVFTLALVVLMAKFARTRARRWLIGYLALFAVATLNRETTLFLILPFIVVCYRTIDRNRLIKAVVLQVTLFLAIQGALQWVFVNHTNPYAGVPGTHYENHLLNNLGLFANPLYFITYIARFGAGLYLPVLLLRQHLNPALGRTLLWFGIPFLTSVLLFGRIQEHRVTIEIVPLIWLCSIQAIVSWNASRSSRVVVSIHDRPQSASQESEVEVTRAKSGKPA